MSRRMRPIQVPQMRAPALRHDPWYKVEGKSADTADVYIFDDIGIDWWTGEGITSKDFARDVNAITAPTINVHINSGGGDVWEGVAIYNTLVQHPSEIHVIVDGLCASAASVIAMAGDIVTMRKGTQMMVHGPWTVAVGNAEELAQTIVQLDSVSASLAEVYAERTGSTVEEMRAVMRAETWFTAEEAVEAGLADEVAGKAAVKADASRLVMYAHAGRENAPTPVVNHRKEKKESSEIPDYADQLMTMLGLPKGPFDFTHQLTEKGSVMDDMKAALAAVLGLDTDSTEDQVVAAVKARIAEPTQAEAPAPAVPKGTTLVDDGVLAELREKAEAGVRAEAALAQTRRDDAIKKAKAEGRISAATAKTWRDQMDADEVGTMALLATLPVNTIPVAEIGHSDGVDEVEAKRDELRKKMNGEKK